MQRELEQINLYPSVAPGSEKLEMQEIWADETTSEGKEKLVVDHVVEPTIYPFLVKKQAGENQEGKPAVLVIPGGAFRRLVMNIEGFDVAEWLNEQGFSAFVLKNRLPSEEHEHREDVALMDAQRAIRLIRSHAKEWDVNPNMVGVMGFSAGGNVASMLSTSFNEMVYHPVDDVDKLSARPDFCVLGYPAISAEVEITSRLCKFVGKDMANVPVKRVKKEDGTYTFFVGGQEVGEDVLKQYHVPAYLLDVVTKYSTDLLVTKDTPQTFIMETDMDRTTRAEHSVRYYLACRREGVSAELHITATGEHGFGLGDDSSMAQTGEWKELFLKWTKVRGIL